jgi:ABC-type glycerol-3-phosphate transport system substrate-binding protein
MNRTKKTAAALALSALVIGITGCSGESETDGGTVDQRVWNFNCDQIQITYDTLGADGTNPDAIQYCLSIGELTP